MRMLFFGRYDPDYSRNAVLMKGLCLNGAEVIECSVRPSARFWPLRLVWQYLRMRPVFDVMLVAFPGQEVMLLARLLTRKPIIFDAFTSHYEGYVEDRRMVARDSFRAKWYAFLDRCSCRLAHAVLTDTKAHARYFTERFGVPTEKLIPVLLGTTMTPESLPEPSGPFTVHFHGSNVPLQGVDIIWGAIRRLWNEDIRFRLVGPFTVPSELRAKVMHEEHVPFHDLVVRMRSAHVCLGVFGVSAKTERVIPNKVYEALAAGRPVVTADTDAIRELLDDDSVELVPRGDPDALTRAILRLKSDGGLREHRATFGQERLLERATPAIVGQKLVELCERLTLRT